MRISQLTKYMKSRLSNCIYCGKEITDNQEFQYCSTKAGRYVAYIFIHNDCIPAAQAYVRGTTNADMKSYLDSSKDVKHIDRASTYSKMYSKEEVLK